MFAFIVRRLLQSFIVVFVMTLIVFCGVNVIGDPVALLINPEADQEGIEAAIRALGLDRPIYEQYWYFLVNMVQGDLGKSFIFAEPALQLILQKMPATLELAFAAILIVVVIGIPLGVYAGLHPDSKSTKLIMVGSILGFSLPTFWVGLMLIMVFAVMLGWLPSTGRGETRLLFGVPVSFLTWDGLQHLLLPALNLALFKIALVVRFCCAGIREIMLQDYIKVAHTKELTRRRVVMVALLKNIMISVITVSGLELGGVIALAVVTEAVFAWPGMGKLLVDSIQVLDRPVIVAYLIISVIMFIVINFTVDICCSLLDPRVRLKDSRG